MNLDDQLRSAANDVRSELASATPPPFESPSPIGSRITLLALVVLVIGGGWWLFQPSSEPVTDVAVDTTITGQLNEDSSGLQTPATASAGVVGFGELATSPMAQPEAGTFSIEPDTGVAIRLLAAGGGVLQPVYSRTQSYNADGTLVLLYRTRDTDAETGHVIVDAQTGAVVAEPDLSAASDIENISWDATDPNRLYFTRGNDLLAFDIDTDATEIVVNSSCGLDEALEGAGSLDNGSLTGSTTSGTDLIGLLCRRDDGVATWAARDIPANTLFDGGEARIDAAPVPLISGDGYVVVGDDEVLVLDRTLDVVRSISMEASAFTVAQDTDGTDVLVATVYGGPTAVGTVVIADVESGSTRVVVGPDTGAPYPPRGTQLSTAATDRPNLIAISTFSDETGPLANEIMLLELNGDASVLRRLAHHRAVDTRVDGWPSTPTVAISPDGSRVLFSSNWGTSGIATYEIALPS